MFLTMMLAAMLPMSAAAKSTEAVDSADVLKIVSPAAAKYKARLIGGSDGSSQFLLTDTAGQVVYSHITEAADTATHWDINLPFHSKKQSRFQTIVVNSVIVGWVHPFSAPAGIKNNWEIAIPDFIGIRWNASRATSFSLSLGLGGTMYNAGGKGRHLSQIGKALVLTPNAEGMAKVKSEFSSFDILLPLTFRQNISGDFGFSLSAMASFTAIGEASTTYNIGDVKYRENFKGLQLRPITGEFMFGLGWMPGVNAYFKYTPWSKFRNGFGPQFKQYSIGMLINF